MKGIFDDNFAKVFSLSCEVVNPQELDGLEDEEYPKRESVGGEED